MTHSRCVGCQYWLGEGMCNWGYDSPYEDWCPYQEDVLEQEEMERIDLLEDLVRKGEMDFSELSEEDQMALVDRWGH